MGKSISLHSLLINKVKNIFIHKPLVNHAGHNKASAGALVVISSKRYNGIRGINALIMLQKLVPGLVKPRLCVLRKTMNCSSQVGSDPGFLIRHAWLLNKFSFRCRQVLSA